MNLTSAPLTPSLSLQQLNIVSPLQLLYYPQLVMQGEVSDMVPGVKPILVLQSAYAIPIPNNQYTCAHHCDGVGVPSVRPLCPCTGVEVSNLLSLLWLHWIRVPVQHDFPVS